MKNVCRLCAKEKTSRQLMYSIGDNNLDIEQKLIACCRWNSFIANEQMPKMICADCWKILEKSFAFAETVALAQQQLLNQLIDIKIEVGSLEPINEPIESKDEPIDSDAFNELPNRLVEPINILASSLKNNECAKFESKYTNINSGMVNEEGRSKYPNYEQQDTKRYRNKQFSVRNMRKRFYHPIKFIDSYKNAFAN